MGREQGAGRALERGEGGGRSQVSRSDKGEGRFLAEES